MSMQTLMVTYCKFNDQGSDENPYTLNYVPYDVYKCSTDVDIFMFRDRTLCQLLSQILLA